MQTFLPYADFKQCAQVLDHRRLGKQRVECKQILNALNGLSNGWVSHPAVQMWRNHEPALYAYLFAVIHEWHVMRRFKHDFAKIPLPTVTQAELSSRDIPPWLGDEMLHKSHRAALLYKEPDHYNQFGWTECPQIEYYWPGDFNYTLAKLFPSTFGANGTGYSATQATKDDKQCKPR